LKRLVLAVSLVFAFGAMCTGGGGGDADEAVKDGEDQAGEPDEAGEDDDGKEVVVVPVPGGGTGEHWCCEYVEGSKTLHAIVAGPAECNAKFAEKKGRWMEGAMCTPCCCKSANDKADASKGYVFELTTPGTCAGVGECLAGDAKECEGMMPEPEEEKEKAPAPRPRPGPKPDGTGNKAKRQR
jgi:hypothetical protein